MIIFYFFLVFLSVNAQDSCEVEVQSGGTTCSDGYTYFYRTPRPENQYTSGWCLRLIVQSENLSQKDAEMLCDQDDAQLSSFDNFREQSKLIGKNTPNVWIRLDGYRKDKCKTNEAIGSDPECHRGRAFYMKNNRTDPTFQLNNFASNEPNYWVKEPNFHAECCNTIRGTEQIDDSCNATPSSKGLLCGKLPQ